MVHIVYSFLKDRDHYRHQQPLPDLHINTQHITVTMRPYTKHTVQTNIIHKFLEKHVCDFVGRVCTASTFFRGRGRAWFTEQARPPFQPSAQTCVHQNYKLA